MKAISSHQQRGSGRRRFSLRCNLEKHENHVDCLRSLGLISIREEKTSNDIAWGRDVVEEANHDSSDEESSSDEEYSEGNQQSSTKRKRKKKVQPKVQPREARKSRRLMNIPSEEHTSEDPTEKRQRIRQERWQWWKNAGRLGSVQPTLF